MTKNILKSLTVGFTTALLLTACSSDQEKIGVSHTKVVAKGMAADSTKSEIKRHNEYVVHMKAVKKRKKVKLRKTKVNLKKFCFKDNHSIHYRAIERCK